MKRLFCLALLFTVGVTSLFAQTIPSAKVETASGDIINTSTLIDGKPFILSFWSTTCKPCILELNAIDQQLEEWLEEADFKVIAVSVDDTRSSSKAKAMASGYEWQFTTLFDKNQDFKRAMNVTTIPQVYVVDGSGKVVYSHSGYTPGSEATLLDKIIELKK